MDDIQLKDRVEVFLESDVGKFVFLTCKEEVYAAQNEFKDIDPEDTKAVKALHQRINYAEGAFNWFKSAILAGYQALAQLDEMDTDDEGD